MIRKIYKIIKRKYNSFISLRKVKEYGEKVFVNGRSSFTRNTSIGNNCHFNGMKITGNGKVTIGDNFHSGKGCMMITSNHNYDTGKCIPYDETMVSKDIVIEDNVWLGVNVLILGGVIIGEGAIVQAGSVVSKDIGPCEIAGGHPAKAFKKRDEEHYYKLKKMKKFF